MSFTLIHSIVIRWLPAFVIFFGASSLPAQFGPKVEPAAMGSGYNPLAWRGEDFDFGVDTLHSSFCALQLSKYVAEKTSNPAVQNVAFTQAYEQQKIHKTLSGMAKTFGTALPPKSEVRDCSATNRMRELSGAELDRVYLGFIAQNSAADVKRFESEAQMPRVPSNWSLWSFARTTLPAVRQDAAAAAELKKSLTTKASQNRSR